MSDGQRCFGVPKLNNHNYQAWKFKMEMHLIREKTWKTISENPPNPMTVEHKCSGGDWTLHRGQPDESGAELHHSERSMGCFKSLPR